MGPCQRNMTIEEGSRLINYALSRGINLIDTAHLYKTYPYIKKALQEADPKLLKDLVIISRSYDYTYEGMMSSFQYACKEMGVNYISIFMLHEMESELTIKGHQEALNCLIDLKKQGQISLTGISTHYIRAVRGAADHPQIDCIFAVLNPSSLGIMDGSCQEMEAALKYAKSKGKNIFIMKAAGGGHLAKTLQESISYIRGLSFVDSVIIGMQSIEEIKYNSMLFQEFRQNPQWEEQRQELYAGIMKTSDKRRLFIEEFCTGCGSCIKVCPFGALSLKEGQAFVDESKCILCSYCAYHCPDFCLKVL